MSLSPGGRFGQYSIRQRLGVGGMGEVWRATDERLVRDVALKVLPVAFAGDPERLARFAREAQLLAQLNHPNIAAIYGVEEVGGARALVMELVEGPTLAELVARGPLPIAEVLQLSRQLADALENAHARGIVHRDLKPANIKVKADGQLKVLDFGLAKALERGLTSATSDGAATLADSPTVALPLSFAATAEGVILGTAAYMAPEQAKGKTVDRRADIWAFGVVVYEMLTGRAPFRQESLAETLAAVLHAEINLAALPPQTPEPLRRLLRRCLTRTLDDRLRDIGDARFELQESAVVAPSSSPNGAADSATGSTALAAAAHPRRWLGRAAAFLVTAALLLGIGRFTANPQPSPLALRAYLPPPPELRFATAEGPVRISADGRRLVFALDGSEAQRGLWIQNLADEGTQRIPATEKAYEPFWSPDGSAVGFFKEPSLMRYDLASGAPASPLAPVSDARGGSWSPLGVIVFAPNGSGPLARVAETGGKVEAATVLGEGETAHLRPQFLPDGRRFLYYVSATSPERSGLAVASLDDPHGRFLLPAASPPLFVPAAGKGSDWLVSTRDGYLLAQRFDQNSLTTQGPPLNLANEVDYVDKYSNLAVTAAPELLLFHRKQAGVRAAELFRNGQLSRWVGEGNERNLDLSRDGHFLAMEQRPGTVPGDLWVIDLDRQVRTRLTSGPEAEFGPVWSVDGQRIFYSVPRGDTYFLESRLASGVGEATPLLTSKQRIELVAALPDGLHLLAEIYGAGREDLVVIDLATQSYTNYIATPAKEMSCRPSPDGRWVAYISDESGRDEVYIQPYPATGERWKVSENGGDAPRWRGDGRELYYLAKDQLVAVPVAAGRQLELGAPQPLFRINSNDYVVSADGQRFLFVDDNAAKDRTPLTLIAGWQKEKG